MEKKWFGRAGRWSDMVIARTNPRHPGKATDGRGVFHLSILKKGLNGKYIIVFTDLTILLMKKWNV